MRDAGEFETDSTARTVARAAKSAAGWSNARNVKHEHRTDRIDVDVIEERVESATRERHVSSRLLRRFRLIDRVELGNHRRSDSSDSSRCTADCGIRDRSIEI